MQLRTKVRYADFGTLSPGSLTGTYVFSGNSLFDPNVTGVGHQPRGYDQLMSMYDHYVVHGATMTVTFSNAASNEIVRVAAALRDSATVGSWRDYVEGGSSHWKIGTTSRPSVNLRLSGNSAQFLGRGDIMSDPTCKGYTTESPTEQWYFHIAAAGMGVSVSPLSFQVLIEYDVSFIEPVVPGQS